MRAPVNSAKNKLNRDHSLSLSNAVQPSFCFTTRSSQRNMYIFHSPKCERTRKPIKMKGNQLPSPKIRQRKGAVDLFRGLATKNGQNGNVEVTFSGTRCGSAKINHLMWWSLRSLQKRNDKLDTFLIRSRRCVWTPLMLLRSLFLYSLDEFDDHLHWLLLLSLSQVKVISRYRSHRSNQN